MTRYYRNNSRSSYRANTVTTVSDGRPAHVCTEPQEGRIRKEVAYLTEHIDKAPPSLQSAVEALVDSIPVSSWLTKFLANPWDITKADASLIISALIDATKLLSADPAVRDAIAAVQAAQYPGLPKGVGKPILAKIGGKTCTVCGTGIVVGQDYAVLHRAAWVNYCVACATTDADEAQAKADAEAQARLAEALQYPGLHLAEGKVWRVNADGVHVRRWGPHFRPVRSFPVLNAETLLTGDRATAYAAEHKRCIACSEAIGHGTERRSLAVGYGPVCAKNYGWYYPTKDEAEAILARHGR